MSAPAGRDELRLAAAHDQYVERREVDPCAECADEKEALQDTVKDLRKLNREMANENQRLRLLLAQLASDIGDAMERLKA